MRALCSIVILASCLLASPLRAQVTTTLTITPSLSTNQNYISASSSAQYGSTTYQNTFPSSAPWTGTVTVQLDNAFAPTTLTILSAEIVLPNTQSVYPDPSNFRGNYSFGYPGAPDLVSVSLNSGHGSFASTALSLSGGPASYQFAPGGRLFGTISGQMLYRVPTGITQPGSFSVGQNIPATGSLAVNGSMLSLQFPVDLSGSVQLTGGWTMGEIVSFHMTGTLTATGVIPEPSTWALALGGAGLLGLVVRWRHGARG